MNKNVLQGQWHQLKGAVKTQWGRLTDNDLTQIAGDAEQLIGRVQERYGYLRDRAEEEVNTFLSRQRDFPEPVQE